MTYSIMKQFFSFKILLILLGMFVFSNGFSQGTAVVKPCDPFLNPVILSHYTLAELQSVIPKKLTAINYYYTESFILDSIACNQCRTFNKATFDVSQFEQFRKQSERYVRIYTKYGYKLTLLSKDEMLYEPVR